LWCCSVHAALLRPVQVLGRSIASASQVSASALKRRYGVDSLAHRAGSAIACGSARKPLVFVACVAHARYGHPLRFYIRPHFGKCRTAATLKLRLVPHTASRPHGFPKQALCKVAFAGYGRTAIGASRPLARPTRRRLHALALRCWSGINQALRAWFFISGLRPSTLGLPRPPWALPAARHRPARSARPPPRGSLRTALENQK
jgi:hypothetical protein